MLFRELLNWGLFVIAEDLKMVNTKGVRRGTRYMFARDFRKRGRVKNHLGCSSTINWPILSLLKEGCSAVRSTELQFNKRSCTLHFAKIKCTCFRKLQQNFFCRCFIGSYFRFSLVLQVLDVVCHNWRCIFLFHLGTIPLSTYMKVYKVGDYVDIKVRLLLKIEI